MSKCRKFFINCACIINCGYKPSFLDVMCNEFDHPNNQKGSFNVSL